MKRKFYSPALAVFLSACLLFLPAASCSSAINAVKNYVPIGLIAFDGAINIISPAPGSPLQVDKALVDGLWQSVNTALTNYENAPAEQKQTHLGEVIAALNAVEGGVGKTLSDLGVSGNVNSAVQAALVLTQTTLAALQARLQPSPVASAKLAAAKKSVTVNGQSLTISGNVEDFKRDYNHIMQIGGYTDHQLK